MTISKIHLRVRQIPTANLTGVEWTWQVHDHFNEQCCRTVRSGFAPYWRDALPKGMAELKRYLKTHCRHCGMSPKSASHKHHMPTI